MNDLNNKNFQIIKVLASADLPESVIRAGNIDGLINSIIAAQKNLHLNTRHVDNLRKDGKKKNFVSNWWNDLDEKIQDAQIDLNKSIDHLTEKSSQLLIVNTAISKILSDQQNTLLNQQNILRQQTEALEKQNKKIIGQQEQLAQQQEEINRANQGLMEAKGITQEQAQKLVGCVVRVTEAEKKIDFANKALYAALKQYIDESTARCISQFNTYFTEHDQHHDEFEQQFNNALLVQSKYSRDESYRLATEAGQLKIDLEQRLKAGFTEQEQRYGIFEQKSNSVFSAQSKNNQEKLDCLTAEAVQFKEYLESRLIATIADQDQRCTELEQNIVNILSENYKNVETQLDRAASSSAEFKVNLAQQLQEHIKNMLENNLNQDSSFQKLKDIFSMQLQKLHANLILAIEQKYVSMAESVKDNEMKHLSVLQGQVTEINTYRDTLKNTENKILIIQKEQKNSNSQNRLAFAGMAVLILGSIGWQVARHFLLL